ncbi:MAG: Phosphomannomutase (EC / Phosphoglucomutase (EC / Phosphoglucosamine mutase (EC [uncultured Sulfurovum sp.]|uniref:Phosphomannomutase )) n=1 Tax=uncultured Sulfurovum sp. TaxID=269237 RepID=A0A6S6TVS0_9BACT|nr:MAG: Phosphomannomutase (EC / Phosphoglucomutase (EC / Phosphoglucosamine mutase (EC [uncultured Sulfurovum sp.]
MPINKTIFREYDIRGIVEKELNEQSVKLIGYFLGKKIKALGGVVSIGYDARTHSPLLRDYLASGLNYAGCKVLDMGMVATPVNYFSNYVNPINIEEQVVASVMITGSHNPSEYNGFKMTLDKSPFFGDDIYALGDEIIANADLKIPDNIECIRIDTKSQYINYMVEKFAHLKGFDKKIVLDGGNGVADTVISDIFDALGLNYEGLYMEPDGTFPNHHPDPSVEENLVDVKALLAKSGDIAFAYDGDADRIAVLTHKHNIKGDQMALLYAMKMENPIVIGEVKCSQVMYDELERRGATAIMYKTGHSNLKVKMKETGADLACEVSGHIFFKHRYFGYDDAIYATLRMLELLQDGIDLDSELDALPLVYSTEELKVKTSEEEKFLIINKLKELLQNPSSNFPKIVNIIEVDGVRINFEKGWGLVRASNTTPVLVTRFESTDEVLAKHYENEVNNLIIEAKKLLG